jgi:hypothetical protein
VTALRRRSAAVAVEKRTGDRVLRGFDLLPVGEKEGAIDWFEKAYEEKLGILIILGGEPVFAPLRPDPRFQAWLRKLDVAE